MLEVMLLKFSDVQNIFYIEKMKGMHLKLVAN